MFAFEGSRPKGYSGAIKIPNVRNFHRLFTSPPLHENHEHVLLLLYFYRLLDLQKRWGRGVVVVVAVEVEEKQNTCCIVFLFRRGYYYLCKNIFAKQKGTFKSGQMSRVGMVSDSIGFSKKSKDKEQRFRNSQNRIYSWHNRKTA